jgi:hypothetical protein
MCTENGADESEGGGGCRGSERISATARGGREQLLIYYLNYLLKYVFNPRPRSLSRVTFVKVILK